MDRRGSRDDRPVAAVGTTTAGAAGRAPAPASMAAPSRVPVPVPAVRFSAPSGSGKTTLLERVIAILTRRGLRVGAVKHDAHRFDIDVPGKDSHRLAGAGAAAVLLADAERLALVRRHAAAPTAGAEPGVEPGSEPGVEELIARYLADMDLVLVEGYRASRLPRILVRRAGGPAPAAGPELVSGSATPAGSAGRGAATSDGEEPPPRVLALVTDDPGAARGPEARDRDGSAIPVLPLDDPERVADFLVAWLESIRGEPAAPRGEAGS
ncbi:MAG: molybdopterin-guanine dinucleotide biosynthesis protein B [Candidatus Krumholzibacteriia bacterium]